MAGGDNGLYVGLNYNPSHYPWYPYGMRPPFDKGELRYVSKKLTAAGFEFKIKHYDGLDLLVVKLKEAEEETKQCTFQIPDLIWAGVCQARIIEIRKSPGTDDTRYFIRGILECAIRHNFDLDEISTSKQELEKLWQAEDESFSIDSLFVMRRHP